MGAKKKKIKEGGGGVSVRGNSCFSSLEWIPFLFSALVVGDIFYAWAEKGNKLMVNPGKKNI